MDGKSRMIIGRIKNKYYADVQFVSQVHVVREKKTM
jgi:hypothetical protein